MKFCMGCMAQLGDSATVCPHCGYVENTPPANPLQMEPGTILADRYIIGRSLGSGGFGVTYIGWDALLETKVAIKEYLPSEFSTRAYGKPEVTVFEGARQEQFSSGMSRFVDEAKRLAKFSHVDGIVHVFDSIEVNNTAYIIMELLEGETLAQRLERENTISPDETVKMMLPMMKSLDEVHQAGIIHRDIAPDNIFITNGGKIKLIDFGAARFATTSHSRSLSVLVKPGFSPEEQYESRGEQGPHTDVYALAATMYRMITGKCPPTSIERMAKVRNHKKDPLMPISKYAPDIDDNYETAIMNALNVRVGDRTEDMEKFEQELTSETKVKRRASNISKIINLRWPLWAKIAVPAAAAALVAFGVLFGTGVIGFKANLKKDIVIPEGQTRVPSVINEEYNVGKEKLEEVNLLMEIREKRDSELVAENLILAQEVNGGAVVQENMLIGVTVSAGVTKQLVPDVAGMELSEAKTQLEGLGFVVETVEQFDDTIAEGCIISQSLTANEEVKTGSKIVLTVSKGRDTSAQVKNVKVPKFVGMNYADAVKLAQKQGISIKVTAKKYSKDYDKNIVMEQAVKANTTIKNTKTVGIVLSLGYEKVEVPDVTLMTEDKATKQLEARGLKANITYQNDETVAAGLVISQSPNGKTKADPESTVNLVVSKGAAAFAMPDVLGMDEAQAKETLGAKGLAVAVNYEQNDSEKEGTVISQSVSAGANVSRGESITITICTHSQTISVPYVVGKTQSDAEDAIEAAGLTPNVVTSYSSAVAKGLVISQTPVGGSGLHAGDMVTISVSLGAEENTGDNTPQYTPPVESTPEPPKEDETVSIWIDQSSVTLTAGTTKKLSYRADSNKWAMTTTQEWKSSNTSVATVDGNGTVTAKSAGTAIITVTATGKSAGGNTISATAVCTVTVTKPAVSGSSSKSSSSTEKPVSSSSSKSSSTSKKPVSSSSSGTVKVPASVALNTDSVDLYIGDTQTLTAKVSPSDAKDKTVTWTSSNSSVAAVSNGKVTAKGAGSAVITAKTSNGKTAACTVKVTKPAVKLSKTSLSLYGHETQTITATTTPSGSSVSWSSSNTSVATVSNGAVTAVASGTETITAQITYQGKTYSANCSVNVGVADISLYTTEKTAYVGDTFTITAVRSPADRPVTWSTSDSSVASVSNGVVTANAWGNATITAEMTYDGVTYKDYCSVTVMGVSLSSYSGSADVGVDNEMFGYYYAIEAVAYGTSLPSVSYPLGCSVSWDVVGGSAEIAGSSLLIKQPGYITARCTVSKDGYSATADYVFEFALYKMTTIVNKFFKDNPPSESNRYSFNYPGKTKAYFSEIALNGNWKEVGSSVYGKVTYNGYVGWIVIYKWE